MKILRIEDSWPSDKNPGVGLPAYYHTKYSKLINVIITAKRENIYQINSNSIKIIQIKYKTNSLGDFSRSPTKKFFLLLKKVFHEFAFFMKAYKYIKYEKPDVVHIYSPTPIMLGIYAKIIIKSKLVMSLHGTDVERIIKSKSYQKLLYIPDQVVTVGDTMAEKLKLFYVKKPILTIGNGVDKSIFYFSGKKRTKQFLHVGNLRWQKGQKYLIEAFQKFHSLFPDYRLIIVGSGEDENYLKKMTNELKLNDTITFAGYLDSYQIAKLMNESYLFLLTSIIEGFPKVLLEAMSCGTPIISTDAGSVKSVLKDCGIVVPIKNSDYIFNAMIEMLNINKWLEMQRLCISYSDQYSWEIVSEKLDNIYKSLKGVI